MNSNTIKTKTLGIFLSLALVLSLAAAVLPATPAQAQTTWYVDDDNCPGPGDGSQADPFCNIQDAIDAADPGDTIKVYPGTYAEAITINEEVTLTGVTSTGADAWTTGIPGADNNVIIDYDGATATMVTISASNVTLQGFKIDVTDDAATTAIQCATAVSDITIQYCTFTADDVADRCVYVLTNQITNLTISYCQFSGGGGQYWLDIGSNGGCTGDNNFTYNNVNGMECRLGLGTNNIEDITISHNTFSNADGIWLNEPVEPTEPVGYFGDIVVQYNTFSGGGGADFAFAVENNVEDGDFEDGSYTTDDLYLECNDFGGTFAAGAYATVDFPNLTSDLDAQYNWWGDNTGPTHAGNPGGTGNDVSDNVDYDPWLSVTVTQPNAGDCIKAGISYNVQWASYSCPGALATISYSTNGGTTYTQVAQVGGLNQGANSWSWDVPSGLNSTNCMVKVEITASGVPSYSDESDAVFTIDSVAPTVTLGSPAGGECWQGGSNQTISFVAVDNLAGNLDYVIEYSPDGGSTWVTLATPTNQPQGTYNYAWNPIPSIDSTSVMVRVKAKDCAQNENTATSGAFTIDSTAPTVTVTKPTAGELLTGGSTYTIEWVGSDNLGGTLCYDLDYSTDGGGTWTDIIQQTGAVGTNTYDWTVPGVDSSNCQIRAQAYDCASCTTGNPSGWSYSGTFTIQDTTPPTVQVISPNGGESWAAGSVQTISWTASDDAPGNLTYTLYYCTSYTDCPSCNIPIATVVGPQGSNTYSWNTVPTPPGGTSNTCRVRVEARDSAATPNTGEDCSDGNFSIKSGQMPTVTLISPNGGESWQGGTCHKIEWTASDPTDPTWALDYVLKYSDDGGATWNTIVTLNNRDQGTQSFCWAVPNVADTDYRVKVEATGPGGTANDASDSDFTVTAAAAGLLNPTITLETGWNLISLQVMPTCCPSTNPTCCASYPIESVLADVLDNVESVWYYDASTTSWQSYAPGAPSSLTMMTDGKAYWIKMAADDSLTYQGRKCPGGGGMPPTYSYPAGWNMVGFKSTSLITTVEDYLGGDCGTDYAAPIYCWDAASQTWCSPSPGCGDNMEPGKGYWVYFNNAHTVSPGCD